MIRRRRGQGADKEARPAVAVDLDGTILAYGPPEYPELGEPLPGSVEGLAAMRQLGYRIVIYTCRLSGLPVLDGLEAARIAKHLAERGVPFDEIALPGAGKPKAEWYVDDRAVRFEGNWDEVVAMIASSDMVGMASRVASEFSAAVHVARRMIAGMGTVSFDGRRWALKWQAPLFLVEMGDGKVLDRDLEAKTDGLRASLERLPRPPGVDLEVKPRGFTCMGQAGLVGEVDFEFTSGGRPYGFGTGRDSEEADFSSRLHAHLKASGYKVK
jgi:hypothetical protein